jgi:hypothetical protein
LVESLLLFVVTSRERSDAAGTAERIDLVDENDRRRLLVRLLKQVAHPRGADPDEHLDELRSRNRKERNLGLAGDRLRQQGLAGARRPDQQHPLRHPPAEPAIVAWIFQKIDDLAQFLLGLVNAGDVFEGHPGVGFHVHLRLALADRHQTPAHSRSVRYAPADIPPQRGQQQHRHDPRQNVAHQRALDLAGVADAVFVELLREVLIEPGREEPALPAGQRLLQRALDEAIRDGERIDLALMQQAAKLAVGQRSNLRGAGNHVLQQCHQEEGDDRISDIEARLFGHGANGLPSRNGRGRERGSRPLHAYLPLIAIRFTFCCAAGDFGRVTVRTPLLKEAATLSWSTSSTGMRRSKRP